MLVPTKVPAWIVDLAIAAGEMFFLTVVEEVTKHLVEAAFEDEKPKRKRRKKRKKS